MTTSNIETELYLPKTYVFERKGKAYEDFAFMTRKDNGADFVYLPKGLSMVTVTETATGGMLSVYLFGPDGFKNQLTPEISAKDGVNRLWAGQVSSPDTGNAGMWLKINARKITTAGQNRGSVSVQIINFPPEN